jgi:hypothetical protein
VSERRPWDRLPDETSRAFAAFREFRDRGPRRRLADETGRRSSSHRRWAAKFDWRDRAARWDDHLAMIEDVERVEARREMFRTQRAAGRAAQRLAVEALRLLDSNTLTASDVARLLDLGTRLEREALEAQSASTFELSVDDPWDRIAAELLGHVDS